MIDYEEIAEEEIDYGEEDFHPVLEGAPLRGLLSEECIRCAEPALATAHGQCDVCYGKHAAAMVAFSEAAVLNEPQTKVAFREHPAILAAEMGIRLDAPCGFCGYPIGIPETETEIAVCNPCRRNPI